MKLHQPCQIFNWQGWSQWNLMPYHAQIDAHPDTHGRSESQFLSHISYDEVDVLQLQL